MKRGVLIWLVFFGTCAYGQATLRSTFADASNNSAELERIDQQTELLLGSKYSNSFSGLHKLFRATHKHILRQYRAYASLNELVNGTYDCLTATALFTNLLTRAGFEYDVVETNYHIFLLVRTTDGEALLETTDPLNGVVVDREEIKSKVGGYRAQGTASSSYQYHREVFRKVNQKELIGLLLFNQAVNAYNTKDWALCGSRLMQSLQAYPANSRALELVPILLYSVATDKQLTEEAKKLISARLKEFEIIPGVPIAAR